MTPNREGSTLPILALIVASIIWSSSFVALKVAFQYYSPMFIIFGRMAVAALCFLGVWRKLCTVHYRKGDWKPLLFMGFCEPCLYYLFEATALQYTDASQAGLIVAILPLMVAIGARIFLKEHPSRRTWFGFVLTIAGACWLSLSAQATKASPNPIFGNSMEFMAMICASGYMITLKRMSSHYSPLFLTAVQAFCGTIFYLPIIFLPGTTLPTAFAPIAVGAIIYLGIGSTVVTYGLYNFGASRIPASQASAFTNLIPVLSLFMGVILLDEQLVPTQYVASAVVLAGVWISQDRNHRRAATKHCHLSQRSR